MHRSPPVTGFLAASFALHLLSLLAVIYVAGRVRHPLEITPVNIVDLPQEVVRRLPRLDRPVLPPPPQAIPSPRPAPPAAVPAPSRFGSSDAVQVPKTAPAQGKPEGSEHGTSPEGVLEGPHADRSRNPLPFLSQAQIDELARKGMPERRPGDDSVTLDTDEFKFISYNRWLKIRVESLLKYPELAALSGLQGTLYIKFDIMKDGSLEGLEVLKSSGYKILDDEALRAIQASAPFQPLPDDWKMGRYSIRAAVLFYLSGAYIR